MPERYYLKNQTNTRKEDMNKVTVGRGSIHEHEIHVETKGVSIRYSICWAAKTGNNCVYHIAMIMFSLIVIFI